MVVMGCGRVGSRLARQLDELGHSVAVIDIDASAFRRLGSKFSGTTIKGVGFDQDTLHKAGIEGAAAFAAVSSGDNSNIIAARVARETFNVPNVVARIYDPKRAEVYERLGIPTVATVSWTASQMLQRVLPVESRVAWIDPTSTIVLAEVPFGRDWIGHRVDELADASQARVAFITRYGEAIVPTPDAVVQEGDLIHAVFHPDERDLVQTAFMEGPR